MKKGLEFLSWLQSKPEIWGNTLGNLGVLLGFSYAIYYGVKHDHWPGAILLAIGLLVVYMVYHEILGGDKATQGRESLGIVPIFLAIGIVVSIGTQITAKIKPTSIDPIANAVGCDIGQECALAVYNKHYPDRVYYFRVEGDKGDKVCVLHEVELSEGVIYQGDKLTQPPVRHIGTDSISQQWRQNFLRDLKLNAKMARPTPRRF